MRQLKTEADLAAIAVALGAQSVEGWSERERLLASDLPAASRRVVDVIRRRIKRGYDPLGTALNQIRTPEERRPTGATYTPSPIVRAMLRWAVATQPDVSRVVDPGVGSARFLVAAGRRFGNASLVGIDIDPLTALIARGHVAAAGLARRTKIIVGDFRSFGAAENNGNTLWIGNPPYVRHHLIEASWKEWFAQSALDQGFEASQLAGLHVHFFLATLLKAKPGDLGAFITAAEWLDVNYGRLVRELFLGPLGGRAITLLEPTARPFPDAAATAAITCFHVGSKAKSIRLRRVESLEQLNNLSEGRSVRRERLEAANRWTPLTRVQRKTPEGFVELGELCRVHRGQVTGANKVWIAGEHSAGLPRLVLFASVTKARELFNAHGVLNDPSPLRRVIDLPSDLETLDADTRASVEAFLKVAKRLGANKGYVAQNRKAWWSVGLREPAPILATYMARRSPAFVRNKADARHINIAHGIYPREVLSEAALTGLAAHLNRTVAVESGRTYAGGLTKFEPKEMERLLIPDLAALTASSASPVK